MDNSQLLETDHGLATYADFLKVELRVGEVVVATMPEWSNKLMELQVDFGELGRRTIFSGISRYYQPSDLIGKKFPFVFNLTPRKMGQGVSQGMMLMVDQGEDAAPLLIEVSSAAKNGAICR